MKINKDYMLKEIAGETMLVYQNEQSVDFSKVITLNELGAFIFKLIQDNKSEEEIINCILKEYEGEEDVVRNDVYEFVNKLKELKIVEVC